MKIYGGDIYINSEENGIDSNGDIFIAGGKLILFGASNGQFQPITECGLLKITNGIILAGGANGNGGVIANTTQFSSIYYKNIEKDSLLQIYNNNNNSLIINMTIPKDIEYLYFNYPYNFTIKINGIEIDGSDSNIRTLISSESEDFDNYSTINKIENDNIHNNISSILKTNIQNQKESIPISTNLKENTQNSIISENNSQNPKIEIDFSTIPKQNIKTQLDENNIPKTNIGNTVQNDKSTIPQQNIKSEVIFSTIYQQNLNTKSSFPKQTISSTAPKQSQNLLGKSTIPVISQNQKEEQKDSEHIEYSKESNGKENLGISDSITNNVGINDLSGFIKVSIILIGVLEFILL